MTERSHYKVERIDGQQEIEQKPLVPIIDFIRHGRTEYRKAGAEEALDLKPGTPLDSEHLDLTEEGIQDIRETADQIETIADKEKEIVFLLSSPKWRTVSSSLVLEQALVERGFTILNPNDLKITDSVTERHFADFTGKRQEEIERIAQSWEDWKRDHPGQFDVQTSYAEMLGEDVNNIFYRSYEGIHESFMTFLRHMNNISKFLTPETMRKLEGKRLRIICLSHEEIPREFIRQVFEEQTFSPLKNGQILEIRPENLLTRENDNETLTKVVLYPKGEGSKHGEVTIKRKFSPRRPAAGGA